MATNGIDKDYSFEVVIPYPVHFFVFRKNPNLTLDELKISDEELYQAWIFEHEGNNFRLSQDLLKPSEEYLDFEERYGKTHASLLTANTYIVNVEECEE